MVDACRALIDRKRWNLAHGRVTISTVGLVSQIRKLTKELPEISLALSLHAPNQPMRTRIVPTANHFPIESLIEALDRHMMAYLEKRKKSTSKDAAGKVIDYTSEERAKESSRRRAMIEYVMLEGDTSSFECAHQLGKLCENRLLVVNLIPYNKTNVKDKLDCPSWEHMKEFQRIVCSYGTFCTIRRTMGADIDSACGQLITSGQHAEISKLSDSLENQNPPDLKDIEDVGVSQSRTSVANKSTIRGKSASSTKTENQNPSDLKDIEDAGVTLSRPSFANKSTIGVESASSTKTNSLGVKHRLPRGEHANESLSGDANFEHWIQLLSVATTVSATCFAVATVLFLKQSRNR